MLYFDKNYIEIPSSGSYTLGYEIISDEKYEAYVETMTENEKNEKLNDDVKYGSLPMWAKMLVKPYILNRKILPQSLYEILLKVERSGDEKIQDITKEYNRSLSKNVKKYLAISWIFTKSKNLFSQSMA